jgi:hypothetical protein
MKILPNFERGSFRLVLILIVAAGGCFWSGGQGVYTALKNRTPTVLACQDLSRGRPSAQWLVLTNCELHLGSSAYLVHRSKYQSSGEGRITEAYVPIQAPGQTPSERCYAVMATKDERILSILEQMRQAKSESAATQVLDQHGSEMVLRRDVSGLVRFGIEERNGERSKLAGLRSNLAPDYVLISEGEKPNLGTSAGLVLLGVLLVSGLFFMARANREETSE